MKKLTVALILGLLATAAHAQQASTPLTKVRMAYDGFSMTSAPLNYAVQQGIFKRFGLDLTPTFIGGGSMLTQAIVGGSLRREPAYWGHPFYECWPGYRRTG